MNNREQLRHRYRELVNQELPQQAKKRQFPVYLNHCFGRIILDNLFGRCWYEVLNRQEAAYKQLSDSQLKDAIALAEAMIEQADEYTWQLNQNSLQWRGKG